MKRTRTSKIMAAIYNDLPVKGKTTLREKILTDISFLAGSRMIINVTFNSTGTQAFTKLEKDVHKRRIVFGGRLIQQITHMPMEFTDKKSFKTYLPGVLKAFYGLPLHEMAHNLFTDMISKDIIEYPQPEYIPFLHSLFNIIEDAVIESSLSALYKIKYPRERNPKVYFNYIIKELFVPQAAEFKNAPIADNFLQYLLLVLRCGKKAIAEPNEAYKNHEKELEPKILDVLKITNPTARLKAIINLGEWIIKNIPEINFKVVAPPAERKSGSLSKSSDKGSPMESLGDSSKSAKKKMASTKDSEAADSKAPEPAEEEEKDEDEVVEKSEGDIDDGDLLDEVFNDEVHDGDDHEWVIAKEDMTFDESVLSQIDKVIEENKDEILSISQFLKLFKSRQAPRKMCGFTRGKLNVRAAIKNEFSNGCNLKIFDQKVKRGKDIDVAISLLADNSGSMTGTKSIITNKGILWLAQACDWADIPLEVNAFTKTYDSMDGTCITIVEKDFDDKFSDAKPYFAINHSEWVHKFEKHKSIPTFAGNSEEINLYYIWQKLRKVKHKTKILMVLCDGATTGSRVGLKEIIQKITDDGIVVIGLGIMTDISAYYPENEKFLSTSDLETKLPNYLLGTLEKYITK